MLKRIHFSPVILSLILAGPAVAEGQFPAGHRAALVEISTLTAESDFTVFMHEDVPEDLRRAALRRLWVLMQLPVSCHDLCYEPEPVAPSFTEVASEKLPVATR